jgi:hypothetical protein
MRSMSVLIKVIAAASEIVDVLIRSVLLKIIDTKLPRIMVITR